ncbi:Nitric oxide-responding transcriptional regulator Dnr (Crp/Fnr family) [hydrothermal vent metagenome]|uniref:Nitric oxide-responding transcriptional regulator Dnr (Crp/Fnr family) n=1 Tax=hydrothermal vent metagenome TaxID=652676 RepID=A0A1W1BA10_9ZZZZ
MKTLTKITTITLLLGTSTLFASHLNDYAITNNYKLLNDMNFAKKQQTLILDMNRALETNHVDMDAYKQFTKVLLGLVKGDESLNLKGTNIPKIKTKLNEIQELWKIELSTLSSAKSNKDTKKAMEILNSVLTKMNEAVSLYNKSYNRFKQKSKLSSIVGQHMIASEQKQMFAFNFTKK